MRTLTVLALLLTACASAPAKMDEVARVGAARDRWQADWNGKRLDDIMALYDDEAVFLRPTAERTTGAPAIRSLFTRVLAANTPHIVLHPITMETSGNLAYDSGTYDETIVSDGAMHATRGDYLIIFKRQGDGRWLITHQAWSDINPRHD